jgi:hypothetical protein
MDKEEANPKKEEWRGHKEKNEEIMSGKGGGERGRKGNVGGRG